MNKAYLIFFVSIVLSGCSEMNSSFDCPMTCGVHCESLDKVNARIDHGEIGNEELNEINYKSSFHNLNNKTVIVRKPSYHSVPLRYGEKVLHIWVAPYEDIAGNYHDQSEIYTVVKGSRWVSHPFKAIETDEG